VPADSEVHVWWIDDPSAFDGIGLNEQPGRRSRSEIALRRRAARRGALRRVLGAYTAGDPLALEIDRSCRYCGDPDHGRPRLLGNADVSFSTASRPGKVVVAIATAAMSVGVDIESLAGVGTTYDIWRVGLTPSERTVTDPADADGTARLWCRKEAALKAMGLGIRGRAPDTLDVREDVVEGWHLADLPTPDAFVGAVAARSRISRIVSMREATD
jgi:4'-phosphopantetheinyl transferase